MKLVTLSIFVLALGLFTTSCSSSETSETTEETRIEDIDDMPPTIEEVPVMDSTATEEASL